MQSRVDVIEKLRELKINDRLKTLEKLLQDLSLQDFKKRFFENTVQLYFKSEYCKTLTLSVHLSDDVKSLKTLIFDHEGTPECQQYLVYAGKKNR